MTSIATLLVSQWFPPEPIRVPLSIAQELQARGHVVTVLTGIPNYPDGRVPDGYRPWQPRSEVQDGVDVQRAPLYPSHDGSAVRRMLNYTSWACTSTIWGFGAIRRADVALVYSSPGTAATAPALWRWLSRTPYVLLIQDLWPDSVTSSGLIRQGLVARLVHAALDRFVSWTYRGAARIVVISPGMTEVLVARGVPRDKISLIYNWAPDETPQHAAAGQAMARAELGIPAGAFVVTYAGNHGPAQGLDRVIQAAGHFRPPSEVMVVLAGDGLETAALEDQARRTGCQNVRFVGRLSSAAMATLRAATDVQLVSLTGDELFAVTMPSKVQSILASAQPLIVMAPGDAADVAEISGAGWAVDPGDAAGLVAAIEAARRLPADDLASKARSGRRYYEDTMSKDMGGASLDRLLRHVARRIATDGAC